MELSQEETEVLKVLSGSGELSEEEIQVKQLGQERIRSAISWLQKKELIDVRVQESIDIIVSQEAKKYDINGLPEVVLFNILKNSGTVSLDDIYKNMGETTGKIAVAQLSRLGLRPVNGTLSLEHHDIFQILETRQETLHKAVMGNNEYSESEREQLDLLLKRSGLLEKKPRKTRFAKINKNGIEIIQEISGVAGIGQLTSDIIRNESYRESGFRSYDLNLPGIKVQRNTEHPLMMLINQIREIFVSLGFQEIRDDFIEKAGWNMDALFIPQNHPARDMQDTFFVDMEKPSTREDKNLFRKIGKIHESGFPGYSGWGYKWSMKEAEKLLLRTHTTASTMRHLHNNPTKEQALFSVDRIFRHESMDWKHLAEFHQVEGVVYSKNATFQTLKWILRKFYGELGFDNVELIPSYYPYTEPSMDIVVEINGKEVEMGGSGIIRPEVNRMLGLKHNVIAWGLGLERLAMLYYGLDDIRKIYNSDLRWLQSYNIKL